MSERSSVRQLRSEGHGLDIAVELRILATEAESKINRVRRAADRFTDRFIDREFPDIARASRRDFSEFMSPEKLAGQLGISFDPEARRARGSNRQALLGSIDQLPVVLLTRSVQIDAPDEIGRAEVWMRALAGQIPDAGQVLWPIVGYGNFGRQTYTVEPQVSREQFFDFWGGPESIKEIARDSQQHPEAIRAFFSCFTQVIQFLKALEASVEGGICLLPRDVAKGGGNLIWEEGRLRIRDLGLWQVASARTPDLKITRRAYQWAAINQFLSGMLGKVFGTDLEFSQFGRAEKPYTDSRFRGKKTYLRNLSKAIGGGADLSGFVEEWNRRISLLVQRISQMPGWVGYESLPVVPGFSDMVYTGSPVELIEGVLKNYGLWIPAGTKTMAEEEKIGVVSEKVLPVGEKSERRKKSLRRKRSVDIVGEQEEKMAGITAEIPKMRQAEPEQTEDGISGLPAILPSAEFMPDGYEAIEAGQEAGFDLAEGDMIFYIGRVGVRLNRDPDGKVYANFSGIEFPENYTHLVVYSPGTSTSKWRGDEERKQLPPGGIPLEEGWDIRIRTSYGNRANFPLLMYREFEFERPVGRLINIELPWRLELPDGSKEDLSSVFVDLKLEGGNRRAVVTNKFNGHRILVSATTKMPKVEELIAPEAVGQVGKVEAEAVEARPASAGVDSQEEAAAVEPPATESALALQPTPEPAPVVQADELPDWLRAPAVEVLVAPTAEAPASLPVEPAAGAAEPSIHEAIPAKPEPEAPAPAGPLLDVSTAPGEPLVTMEPPVAPPGGDGGEPPEVQAPAAPPAAEEAEAGAMVEGAAEVPGSRLGRPDEEREETEVEAAAKERKFPEIRFSENARRVAELKRRGGENYDLSKEEMNELVNLFGETMEALAEMFENGQGLVLGGKRITPMELFRMVNDDMVKLEEELVKRFPAGR